MDLSLVIQPQKTCTRYSPVLPYGCRVKRNVEDTCWWKRGARFWEQFPTRQKESITAYEGNDYLCTDLQQPIVHK
jgi:hypothetical protein